MKAKSAEERAVALFILQVSLFSGALDESQFEKYVIERRNRHNSDLFRALCKGSGPDTCVHCVNFNAFPDNGGCSCPSDRATFLPVSRSCVNASTAVNTDFASKQNT